MSVNYVNTGLGNGLSPEWHQAIVLTNADLLSIGSIFDQNHGSRILVLSILIDQNSRIFKHLSRSSNYKYF